MHLAVFMVCLHMMLVCKSLYVVLFGDSGKVVGVVFNYVT